MLAASRTYASTTNQPLQVVGAKGANDTEAAGGFAKVACGDQVRAAAQQDHLLWTALHAALDVRDLLEALAGVGEHPAQAVRMTDDLAATWLQRALGQLPACTEVVSISQPGWCPGIVMCRLRQNYPPLLLLLPPPSEECVGCTFRWAGCIPLFGLVCNITFACKLTCKLHTNSGPT